ncbi:MAG: hypothetical protein WC683_14160, partial [bacterium]
MPALSDPTTWRTHPFSYKGYLFLLDPTVVFEALVNMPGGVSYPIHTFNWDGVISGAYTNVRAGMTVLFGSTRGNDDRGRQRVRLAPTGDDFYIGWSSRGVHDGEVTLFDNTYITVLDDYRVWSKIPYIDESGTAYKDATLQFATNGINPPPVANGGPGYAEFVDPDTNVITVDFDASDSFAVDDGASISTYAWDFDDGTPASSASATASGVTFPPGFRWVHLTVTDSNANSHIAHIPIFAAEKTGTNAPIEDFQVTNQTLTPEGQQISFRILESIPEGTYPDGTLAMYWERERYGSNVGALAGPSGREHMKFIGWHGNENALHGASEEGYLTETTIECVDVVGRLQRLPGFPQIVEREASPASWEEMANANIDRYLHYILHWHSTALDLADFTWSGLGSTYPFTALSSDGQNLYAQADERAQAIAHRLTCDAWGRLWVRPDPQLQDTADRSTTYILDIDETDWSSFEAARQRHPTIHWLHSGAIVASTSEVSAVFCVAPGFAPGQGEGSRDQNYQLVASQSELNTREGHRYARYNSDHGLYTVTIPNRGDAGINPAWMEYVRASISTANAAQRGNSFTDSRFLPMEVDIEHDHEAGTKNYVITVEPFVSGAPAKTEIIETPNFPTWTPPTSTPPPSVYVPGALLPTKLIALMGNGHVAIATSYSHPTAPAWQDATGAMTGDCGSPGGGNNEGGYLYEDLWYPARYWVSNSDGLWVNEDPFGGSAWSLQNNDPLLRGVRKLVQSIRQEGWMAAHVAEGSLGGGRVIYSFDNFATIAGIVPWATSIVTYSDMTVAQGGRATGAGSGVQLYLLGRVATPGDQYIVYSGDGGVTVT